MRADYNPSFAKFYDTYFTGWSREFAPKLADYLMYQTTDRLLIDLCCGTGIVAEFFCESGWRIIGLDCSASMIGIARKRLSRWTELGYADLIIADATNFALAKTVDACICLDGALNHLPSIKALANCFEAVARVLSNEGLFVFDLLQPAHFQHWNQVTMIDDPDAAVVKRGAWDDQTNQGMLRVSGMFGWDSTCQRVTQTLWSRTFTSAEVDKALSVAGMARTECGIGCTSNGLRPEAKAIDGLNRTLYQATKR